MIRLGLYMLFLYTLVICFGFYINQAHGQEGPRSCADYLRICETSCTLRGELYWFGCQGPGFQPDRDRYRCICADEGFRVKTQQKPVQEQAKHQALEVQK